MITSISYAHRSQKRKNSVKLLASFPLVGSALVKAARKHYALVDFPIICMLSFYSCRSQKHKNSVKLSVNFLSFWDMHLWKLLVNMLNKLRPVVQQPDARVRERRGRMWLKIRENNQEAKMSLLNFEALGCCCSRKFCISQTIFSG